MRRAASVAVLVVALAVTASGQTSQTPKKFLGGPLTIEDQGSFFVGGVQKVTDYAVVPAAARSGRRRADDAATVTPQQITIGQMYVQFQIPAKKYGGGLAGHHGPRIHAHRRLPRSHARRPRRLVSVLRPQRRAELRRRSGGTRPLRIRPVGAARRRSAAGARRREGRGGADSELRPDHRQRCVDGVVRPSGPGGFDRAAPAR